MILVDDQSGSKDLYPYIRKLTPDVIMTRVEPPFGDFVWCGNGPDGTGLNVAVEYKKLNDVLDCINDGRFAGHQVHGLVEFYQRRYLLVEGRVRCDNQTGVLQRLVFGRNQKAFWADVVKGGRGFMWADLESWFTTMEEQAQFRVIKTQDEYESARWVKMKHSWYVNKEWEQHDALKVFHVPPPPTASFVKPNLRRRIAKELPDIEWVRSGVVAEHFPSVLEMINAPASEWAAIKVGEDKNGHTLTIGKNRAVKIVAAITGRADV